MEGTLESIMCESQALDKKSSTLEYEWNAMVQNRKNVEENIVIGMDAAGGWKNKINQLKNDFVDMNQEFNDVMGKVENIQSRLDTRSNFEISEQKVKVEKTLEALSQKPEIEKYSAEMLIAATSSKEEFITLIIAKEVKITELDKLNMENVEKKSNIKELQGKLVELNNKINSLNEESDILSGKIAEYSNKQEIFEQEKLAAMTKHSNNQVAESEKVIHQNQQIEAYQKEISMVSEQLVFQNEVIRLKKSEVFSCQFELETLNTIVLELESSFGSITSTNAVLETSNSDLLSRLNSTTKTLQDTSDNVQIISSKIISMKLSIENAILELNNNDNLSLELGAQKTRLIEENEFLATELKLLATSFQETCANEIVLITEAREKFFQFQKHCHELCFSQCKTITSVLDLQTTIKPVILLHEMILGKEAEYDELHILNQNLTSKLLEKTVEFDLRAISYEELKIKRGVILQEFFDFGMKKFSKATVSLDSIKHCTDFLDNLELLLKNDVEFLYESGFDKKILELVSTINDVVSRSIELSQIKVQNSIKLKQSQKNFESELEKMRSDYRLKEHVLDLEIAALKVK